MKNNEHGVSVTLFDKINLEISISDWRYLCENRWFTDTPSDEDIEVEFVTGTGITPEKPERFSEANICFHNYVNELRTINSGSGRRDPSTIK